MKLPYSLERDSTLGERVDEFVLCNYSDSIPRGLQLDEKAVGNW
jgi:hypothetical protein